MTQGLQHVRKSFEAGGSLIKSLYKDQRYSSWYESKWFPPVPSPVVNAGMRYDMSFCAARECSGNCMHEIKAHAKLHRAISIYLLFTW